MGKCVVFGLYLGINTPRAATVNFLLSLGAPWLTPANWRYYLLVAAVVGRRKEDETASPVTAPGYEIGVLS